MVRPSIQPSSRSRSAKAVVQGATTEGPRYPIVSRLPRCYEALVLEAMRRARFSIISSVRRHAVAGLIVKDLFRGFEFWLVDEGLESSLPDEAVLARVHVGKFPGAWRRGRVSKRRSAVAHSVSYASYSSLAWSVEGAPRIPSGGRPFRQRPRDRDKGLGTSGEEYINNS